MNNSKIVAVVIPIYKPVLNDNEFSSLVQCFKILKNFPIIFFCSPTLNLSVYKAACQEYNIEFRFEIFDAFFFKDLKGYNKIMLSLAFYKRFKQYNYILLYQLDAWLFKDELLYWCNKGYDYIGAPWFEGLSTASAKSAFIGVGNGGFSLRKVKSYIKVLTTPTYITPFKTLMRNLYHGEISISFFLSNISVNNNTFHIFNNFNGQEDGFWGHIIPQRFNWFKLPGLEDASKFSMEINAPLLYKINGEQLPFGCHAWEKYHTDFWLDHIILEKK